MTQEQRAERMKKAGIPMPIKSVNEGAINSVLVTSANADMHSRLQALKKGANRNIIKNIVQSSGRNGGSNTGFQAIPETRINKNHPSNKVTPGKSVPLQSFTAKSDPNLSAIDALYNGDAEYVGNVGHNPPTPMGTQPELSVPQDGLGPAFDPSVMIANRKLEMQNNSEYLKYAVNPTLPKEVVSEQGVYEQNTEGQAQFNMKYMQQMMEQIAKNTISDVLNSYTEKNRDKLTYENYTKTKDGSQVIKTQDGKYFKLVPVKLKK